MVPIRRIEEALDDQRGGEEPLPAIRGAEIEHAVTRRTPERYPCVGEVGHREAVLELGPAHRTAQGEAPPRMGPVQLDRAVQRRYARERDEAVGPRHQARPASPGPGQSRPTPEAEGEPRRQRELEPPQLGEAARVLEREADARAAACRRRGWTPRQLARDAAHGPHQPRLEQPQRRVEAELTDTRADLDGMRQLRAQRGVLELKSGTGLLTAREVVEVRC